MSNNWTEGDYDRGKYIIKTLSDNNLLKSSGQLPEKEYLLLWDTVLKLQKDLKGDTIVIKLYEQRDLEALDYYNDGNMYSSHVIAMTREKLHSKSSIAAELAVRDIKIKYLLLLIKELEPDIYVDVVNSLPNFIDNDTGGV